MKSIRYIGSVAAGLITAILLIMLNETLANYLFPAPMGLDINNPAQLANYQQTLPYGAYALILFGYSVASFAGGLVSTFLSGRNQQKPALVVGASLTLAGLFNYEPMGFKILSSLSYIPFSYCGYLWLTQKKSTEPISVSDHKMQS